MPRKEQQLLSKFVLVPASDAAKDCALSVEAPIEGIPLLYGSNIIGASVQENTSRNLRLGIPASVGGGNTPDQVGC